MASPRSRSRFSVRMCSSSASRASSIVTTLSSALGEYRRRNGTPSTVHSNHGYVGSSSPDSPPRETRYATRTPKQILAKQGRRIPVITTLHGTYITLVGKDKTYSPVVTVSMNESDVLTAVAENVKEGTCRNC